jgi:Flp pilus assembly protein TadD
MEVRKHRQQRDRLIVREELLRPSRHLGYDRDQLGVYFLEREAFDLAESQFHRAIWLNPYEPLFKVHWAVSLVRLGRGEDAHRVICEVLQEHPTNAGALDVWRRYWAHEPVPSALCRAHVEEARP